MPRGKPTDAVILGRNVRSLRVAKRLSQVGLARAAGISAVYIRKIESCESLNVGVKTLGRIAAALGVYTDALLCRKPAATSAQDDDSEAGAADSDDGFAARGPAPPARFMALWAGLDGRHRQDVIEFAEQTYLKSHRTEIVDGGGQLAGPIAVQERLIPLGSIFTIIRGSELPDDFVVPHRVVEQVGEPALVSELTGRLSALRGGTAARLPVSGLAPSLKSCITPAEIRPLLVTKAQQQILHVPTLPPSKASFFDAPGPMAVFEPRALVAAVVEPRVPVHRSLYCLAPRPEHVSSTSTALALCQRIAMLFLTDWFVRHLPKIRFFRKSVPPPVSAFRDALVPSDISRDTDLSAVLEDRAEVTLKWSKKLTPSPVGKTFDQLLMWRNEVPGREGLSRFLENAS